MPTFEYTVRGQDGKLMKGTSEAENERTLAARLQEQGYLPVKVKKVRGAKAARAASAPGGKAEVTLVNKKKKEGGGFVFGGVKLKDLSIFARQFATMINAGVSLVRCLSVLREQTASPRLKLVVADLLTEVEAGSTLSSAMHKHPKVFSNLAVGLVRAGEVGGVLDETLERLAGFMESDMELRRKVKSAMSYPTLVMIAAVGIVLFLVTFILPKFMAMFKDLGVQEMPAMTAFLMSASDFLTKGFPTRQIIFVAVGTALFIGWKRFTRTKVGKRFWDMCKLRVPVFGALNHKISVARFSRTLGTLLVSGVPILQAMETVAGTVDNEIIADAIMKARAAVREGESIGPPLQKSKLFPPMVVHMVSIGEETGALDGMLAKVADFYEGEVDAALESLTASLEPVMIVGLGAIVGFIVIAMFMPLISVMSSLSGGE
ncbi:MAG TPA: type II secretion system F family protein [Armatimonadota bacterium]|nr:type II secretion system F family protein [Armatimonadota bacterium]